MSIKRNRQATDNKNNPLFDENGDPVIIEETITEMHISKLTDDSIQMLYHVDGELNRRCERLDFAINDPDSIEPKPSILTKSDIELKDIVEAALGITQGKAEIAIGNRPNDIVSAIP